MQNVTTKNNQCGFFQENFRLINVMIFHTTIDKQFPVLYYTQTKQFSTFLISLFLKNAPKGVEINAAQSIHIC